MLWSLLWALHTGLSPWGSKVSRTADPVLAPEVKLRKALPPALAKLVICSSVPSFCRIFENSFRILFSGHLGSALTLCAIA
jgi:hypothetical protein